MTENSWQGEENICLDGETYMLRPTFETLSAIEQQLDTGLLALAGKLLDGSITLNELSVIIACCISRPLPFVESGLLQGGLVKAIESLSRMFAVIFQGCAAPDITRADVQEMIRRFPD